MLRLRLHRSELTYEVALAPPLAAVIDTPGKFVSALIREFDNLNVVLSDFGLDDDGPLEDQGLSCEVDKFDANILLRADRFEISFLGTEDTREASAEIVRGMWQVIASISPEVTPKSHSLLYEMDCELIAGSYRAALEQFCKPHDGLPKGTETAIAYYLPRDSSRGFLDSSVVLNRSAEVGGGILLAATLVFDGERLSRDGAVQEGQERLNELLRSLDIALQDSEAGS
jgi:hypothetical protein